jgi:hypothetical protein
VIHPHADLHPITKLQARAFQDRHQFGSLGFDQHSYVCCIEPKLTKHNLLGKL